MSVTLPAFTPIEETLFLTLCGRALDNRLPHPILADPMAGQLVRALGYDCNRFHLSPSYTRFAIWAANHYHGTQSVAGLIKSPGFDDPREPERWNPPVAAGPGDPAHAGTGGGRVPAWPSCSPA
jgi:hypothetical protein